MDEFISKNPFKNRERRLHDMQKLDSFAKAALTGLLSLGYSGADSTLANVSYNIAEAMLKEREERIKNE